MYNVTEFILSSIPLQEQPSYDYATLFIGPCPGHKHSILCLLPPVHTQIHFSVKENPAVFSSRPRSLATAIHIDLLLQEDSK